MAEPVFSLTGLLSLRKRQLYLIFAGLFLSALLFFAQVSSLSDAQSNSPIPVQTISVPVTPPPAPPAPHVEPPPALLPSLQPIVFSLIMWSQDSALEGALLVKVGYPPY